MSDVCLRLLRVNFAHRPDEASVGPPRAPSLITPADMAHQRNQPSMGDSLKTPHSVSLKVLRYVEIFAATTVPPSNGTNGLL
jgi:hypothetical protein